MQASFVKAMTVDGGYIVLPVSDRTTARSMAVITVLSGLEGNLKRKEAVDMAVSSFALLSMFVVWHATPLWISCPALGGELGRPQRPAVHVNVIV